MARMLGLVSAYIHNITTIILRELEVAVTVGFSYNYETVRNIRCSCCRLLRAQVVRVTLLSHQ